MSLFYQIHSLKIIEWVCIENNVIIRKEFCVSPALW